MLLYALRRTLAHARLITLIALTVALIVGALAGTQAYLDTAASRAVRTVLADQSLQVQTRLADDAAAQADGAATALANLLPADREVWHTIRSIPLRLADTDARLVLLVDPAIADHAGLVDGAWPASPDQAALHAGAATALGVGVGDSLEIAVEGTTAALTLVGTWRPTDHPHWGTDPLAAAGSDPLDPGTHGPAIVPGDALTGLDMTPFAQWTISPGPTVGPADLGAWSAGLAALPDAFQDAGVTSRGLTASGDLPATVADTEAGLASVRAATMIPMLVLALLGLVVLWQLARLLAAVRARETLILLSRGATRRALTTVSAVEALAVAAPGAALGAGAVLLGFAGRPGVHVSAVWLGATAVAAGAVVVLTISAAHAAATGVRPVEETGRVRAALAPGGLVLVVLAAAFTLWRFRRNASPLVAGTARPDALAVAAPALGLVACALLTVALAGPLARRLAAAVDRSRGYSPSAELRQVSRRLPVVAVLVVLVVVAAGTTALAAAYSGTWQASRTVSARVAAGADVRADLRPASVGTTPRGVSDVATLDGVTAATGVVQLPLRLGGETGTLSALPVRDLGVSAAPEDVFGPAVELLTPDAGVLAGVDVPPGDLRLAVTVAGTDISSVQFWVWLHDGVELVRLPATGAGAPGTLAVTVPAGTWRVVAVDADTPETVNVDAIGSPDVLEGSRVRFGSTVFEPFQRLMPERAGTPTVPVLVTPGWEEEIRDSGTDVTLGEIPFRLERVGGIGAVPGNPATRAALADLATLQDALLRTSAGVPAVDELWLATSAPGDVAAALRERLGPQVPVLEGVTPAPDPVSEPARLGFWVAVASALLLVLPAVAAVALVQATARRGEVVVLRAVGLGAAQQGGSRRNELLGVAVGAVVAGSAAGWVVAELVMVDLVRATTPRVSRGVPLALAWDLPVGAAFLALLLVALAAVAAWYGRLVRSQARDRTWREEVR